MYAFIMGIDDRDYMKQSDDNVVNVNDIVIKLIKLAAVLFVLLLCLRFPLIWVKIPLMIAVLFFGWRWIFRSSKSKLQNSSSRPKGKPINKKGAINRTIVQTLIAHDAAGEFGKAKTLIQSLEGQEFPEEAAKELAVIAGNYFPVELEASKNGFRFKLV